jgi:hypothetical protein
MAGEGAKMMYHKTRHWLYALLVTAFASALVISAPAGLALAQSPTRTPAAAAGSEIEFVGVIEAMALNSLIVNQQLIDITGAEIRTTLQAGAVVKIEGFLAADETVIAREVSAPNRGLQVGEAQIVGVMTRFVGTRMVVDGQEIDMARARLEGRMVPGSMVWVRAAWLPTAGVWVARQAGPFRVTSDVAPTLPRGGREREFEIVGTLTAMDPTTITVSGLRIDITRAEIKSRLVIGALVKVHLSQQDGQLVAREVELTRQSRLREGENLIIRSSRGDDNDNSNSNRNDNRNSNRNDNDDDDDDDNDNDNRGGRGNDDDDDDDDDDD